MFTHRTIFTVCSGQHRCMRAFTLVELLAVLAILTFLVAILMPGLSRARGQARFCAGGR